MASLYMKAVWITRAERQFVPQGAGNGGMVSTDRQTVAAEKTARRSIRPLGRLGPYLRRYRGLVAGALVALALAAVTTLVLPVAVRRMIDHGFSSADAGFINTYFTMLFVLAGLLALASAMRYYFVITLGERIVADLRREVFAHVTKLSPAFFDV